MGHRFQTRPLYESEVAALESLAVERETAESLEEKFFQAHPKCRASQGSMGCQECYKIGKYHRACAPEGTLSTEVWE
jgi:hypothetical protein